MAKYGLAAETPIVATTPRNIEIPPSRGVGVLWTSRSRMPGCSLYFVLSRHTAHARANVTMAVNRAVKRYCFTRRRRRRALTRLPPRGGRRARRGAEHG